MLNFGRTWSGELATSTPPMDPDWVTKFVVWLNGRNSQPQSWQRLMISKWRAEWRDFGRAPIGLTPAAKGHSGTGEAIWKKLRDLDTKIKDLDQQIVGFETTQPELAERLESEAKKLRAERKTLAE